MKSKTRKRKCNRLSRKESTDHTSNKEVLEDGHSDAICNKRMKNAGDSIELGPEAKEVITDDQTTVAAATVTESSIIAPSQDSVMDSSNNEGNNDDVNNNNIEAVNEGPDLNDEAGLQSVTVTGKTLQNENQKNSVECQYKSDTTNEDIENTFKENDCVTNDYEKQINENSAEPDLSDTVKVDLEKETDTKFNSQSTDIVCEQMETDIGECADLESLLTANTQKVVLTDAEYKQNKPDAEEETFVNEMLMPVEDNTKVDSLFNETNIDTKDNSTGIVEKVNSPLVTGFNSDLVGQKGDQIVNSDIMNTIEEANIPVEVDMASTCMHEDIAETKMGNVVLNIGETTIEETNGQRVAADASDDKVSSQTSQENVPCSSESSDKGRPTGITASDTGMIIMGTDIQVESEQTVSENENETTSATIGRTGVNASKACEDEISLDGADDITDSQLCALDETMQPVSKSFHIPPKPCESMKATSSMEQRGTRPDMEDGSAIMTGLIKEASYLNKMLLQTIRDMEAAKRKRAQTLKTTIK